jgi:hypothetical protein
MSGITNNNFFSHKIQFVIFHKREKLIDIIKMHEKVMERNKNQMQFMLQFEKN